jgi:hypothetical protein
MSFCVLCGASGPDDGNICSYHFVTDARWADANRIVCDFVHRGIVPVRLPPAQRDEITVLGDPEEAGEALALVVED